MTWLLGVEIAILLVAAWAARHGRFHVRTLTVTCPVDGLRAHLTVAEEGTMRDILGCSRLDHAPAGRRAGRLACDRSCQWRLA